MSLVLDLTPEQEERVRTQAAERGQSPADFLLACAGLAPTLTPSEQSAASARNGEGKTLAEAFAGRTGMVHSGKGYLSKSTGAAFTKLLIEKKKPGRL